MSVSTAPAAMTRAQAQALLDESPFGPWWGYRVTEVDAGRAAVVLPARPELFRPGGVLQGGCAMTLADVAFWLALLGGHGPDDPAVTLEMTTTFLRGARTDLTSTATVLSDGRRVGYGEASTTDADGRLVAHHTLTYLRA